LRRALRDDVRASLGKAHRDADALGDSPYERLGLDPQEAALKEGRRPAKGDPWAWSPSSFWGRLGAGESPPDRSRPP
jgi:hypothetical protein